MTSLQNTRRNTTFGKRLNNYFISNFYSQDMLITEYIIHPDLIKRAGLDQVGVEFITVYATSKNQAMAALISCGGLAGLYTEELRFLALNIDEAYKCLLDNLTYTHFKPIAHVHPNLLLTENQDVSNSNAVSASDSAVASKGGGKWN
jgi:hypothetical protein